VRQFDQSDHGDGDFWISHLVRVAASICRAFCPWRSAVISTLESRISPMPAALMARGGSQWQPRHPWRSQRP
jgi:hypothetical protein